MIVSPTPTDATFLDRVRNQEHDAWAELVQRYDGIMRAFACSRWRSDPERAHEMVQDAWMNAWNAAPRLRNGTSLKSWLMTIVQHGIINDARRQQALRLDSLESLMALAPAIAGRWASDDPTPEEAFLRQEQAQDAARRLHSCLRRLAPAQRRIVVALLESDAPRVAVGRRLNLSHATVKGVLYRTRRLLGVTPLKRYELRGASGGAKIAARRARIARAVEAQRLRASGLDTQTIAVRLRVTPGRVRDYYRLDCARATAQVDAAAARATAMPSIPEALQPEALAARWTVLQRQQGRLTIQALAQHSGLTVDRVRYALKRYVPRSRLQSPITSLATRQALAATMTRYEQQMQALAQ